ncbi:MAG: hypothetical protein LBC51_09585 [Treponema sp.]|jgi:hypothetical protein|nr:hypothetical protein [Treponema sp.]
MHLLLGPSTVRFVVMGEIWLFQVFLFDAVYRDDGITVQEKNENVGNLRKKNVAFIKSAYNKNKKELDKQDFVTAAETDGKRAASERAKQA